MPNRAEIVVVGAAKPSSAAARIQTVCSPRSVARKTGTVNATSAPSGGSRAWAIAGAGSADTYPLRDESELEEALKLTRHVQEVSVEEYIEGEEFTFQHEDEEIRLTRADSEAVRPVSPQKRLKEEST